MVEVQEEQKYERLRELAQEFHLPTLEAFIALEVFDKDGRLIQRHKQRSHSWVRNAYNCLFTTLAGKNGNDAAPFGAGRLNWKDTGGNVRTNNYPIFSATANVDDVSVKGYRAGAANDASGIVVGSGTNAESFEDYDLQTKIDNGSGAGQLSYVAGEAHSISYADTTMTNTLARYFNNNSGGDVDVNEVGLIFGQMSNLIYHCLMSRDKLASTVTVPDTGQLKVTYTIQLTYPS